MTRTPRLARISAVRVRLAALLLLLLPLANACHRVTEPLSAGDVNGSWLAAAPSATTLPPYSMWLVVEGGRISGTGNWRDASGASGELDISGAIAGSDIVLDIEYLSASTPQVHLRWARWTGRLTGPATLDGTLLDHGLMRAQRYVRPPPCNDTASCFW